MGRAAVTAAVVVLLSAAAAHSARAACSKATLADAFSTTISGFTGGTVPFAAAGELALDGKGGITGTVTPSSGGIVARGVAVTGTYTVNSNCTGSATLNSKNGSPLSFDFAVRRNGHGFDGVQTNSGAIVTVRGVRGAQ